MPFQGIPDNLFDDSDTLLTFDREHIWHPYTSMTDPLPCYAVESARGVRIKLADGRELIDGMSSWWAAIHGYNHPALNAAIEQQLKSMAHIMFGGLTHRPAVELAHKLINITADPLQYVFFADSGSVSVEVAIKMAIQYYYAQGQVSKQKLLTVRSGYHGDTLGGMSVCDPVNGMHSMFRNILPEQLFAPQPQCETDGSSNINELEHVLRLHQHEICAVIIEPIVQGAGGMRFYCAEYLQQLRALCDQYHVLLIVDEIATGFGRTGSLFAYEQAGIVPDILCLGKALTGGYMTLAATMTSKKVVDGISADSSAANDIGNSSCNSSCNSSGVLMHGPTFMANPLACAVANASIELLLQSDWQEKVHNIEQQLKSELEPCRGLSAVADVRVRGAIGVVEVKQPVNMQQLQAAFVKAGVWIRPFNKLVYIMPPYIITPEELTQLSSAIYTVLEKHLG